MVLQLLVEGYSNSAMAEKLFVSDSTVSNALLQSVSGGRFGSGRGRSPKSR